MRIHVIRAPTLRAALTEVRESLGEDAVVLDTSETPEGAVVKVGVDAEPAPTPPFVESASNPSAPQAFEIPRPHVAAPTPSRGRVSGSAEAIVEALEWHGAPPLVVRSLQFALETSDVDSVDPAAALADALARLYRFGRPETLGSPVALVGPPGAGKTATLAKLAAARHLEGGRSIALVNGDPETAGATERLDAFAEALGVAARIARTSNDIRDALAASSPDCFTIVDTSGRAPADADDIEATAAEIEAVGNGVLVLSATTAPVEAAELAACFAAAGAGTLVMTQLDIARRIGGLLAAAEAGDLVIAGVSLGRKVGDGLKALTPLSLARLILAPPPPLASPKRRSARPTMPAAYAANGAAA